MIEATPKGPPPNAGGDKSVSAVLGEIVWLLTQSPIHRQLFMSDLEWFCMPPILLQQFRIFNGPQGPAAVAFWAFVSEATEARLMSEGHAKLRPAEWKGGDLPWLIELVAPFGGVDEILHDLGAGVLAGRPFRFHRTGADGRRELMVFDGETKAFGGAPP
jgi:cytolysin-activating lysine-acyltransferase